MKVKIEIFGLLTEEIPQFFKDPQTEFSLERPIALHFLLTEILKIRDSDKVILINGKYMPPHYELQNGDLIQIFPRLEGG